MRACLVIPCYNEEKVLPRTSVMFLDELKSLINKGLIDDDSRILFVNDGSKDSTWDIICSLAKEDHHFIGACLSRNRGHQNALLAGLMEARDFDVTISMDCDGQDDIHAAEKMIIAYNNGADVVYGVRSSRRTDSFFKRNSAQAFYRVMEFLGVETVYNHADYRLISKRVLDELAKFEEVNLFLRGLVPLAGFKSDIVYYERTERIAGESHYPLSKMLSFSVEGITSLSVKPLRIIFFLGFIVALISFIGIIWALVGSACGWNITGWTSLICIICFLSGVQLISVGVIGEYIGKIYLETKHRPRYIISTRTYEGASDDPV